MDKKLKHLQGLIPSPEIIEARKQGPKQIEDPTLTNYCKQDIMSRCTAGKIWKYQKRCGFAEKSTVANRCMSYIEAIDGHCDCEAAQTEIRNNGNKRRE